MNNFINPTIVPKQILEKFFQIGLFNISKVKNVRWGEKFSQYCFTFYGEFYFIAYRNEFVYFPFFPVRIKNPLLIGNISCVLITLQKFSCLLVKNIWNPND